MHTLRRLAPIVLVLLLASAPELAGMPGVREPAAPDTLPQGAPAPGALAAVPRFTLFGWVSPPLALTMSERYAQMVRAGFNVTVLAWDDTGYVADNLARLDATRSLGLHNLLLDNRLDSVFAGRPETLPLADTIVAAYRGDPAFLGYYLGDEPRADTFDRLGEWFSILRARDPRHPAWNSIIGRMGFASHAGFESYTRDYVARVRPAILCNSHYEFNRTGDLHQMAENISTLATVARENDMPFWGVVLLVEHGVFRRVTEGMLRWQVAQWLAYGARGVGYFTYWTPAPDPYYNWQPAMVTWGAGEQTATFDTVSMLNRHAAPVGNVLAGARWLATRYAGSVPPYGIAFAPNPVLADVQGRATIGFFADSTGAPLVFVANADSLARRTVVLVPAAGRAVVRLADDGSWGEMPRSLDGRITLSLAPGDFALLGLTGTVDGFTAGVGGSAPSRLSIDVQPNPARGGVRFALRGGAPGGRLDLLDVGGRRVWSATAPAGETAFTWRGESARGGAAPAGVYLLRYSDRHGTTVRRVAWLGAR
jgi:hypothetical protein